jgi:hypothetical protein
LKARRADGIISVQALSAGEFRTRIDKARLLWDGTLVRMVRINGEIDQAAFNGEATIDLSGASPRYSFEGELKDVAYGNGKMDFDGTLETNGLGTALVANARAEGRLHGRAIAFAPEADFRTVSGCFEVSTAIGGARWKLVNLEVLQAGDTYYGTGATQADGRVTVELTNRGKQVKYTSTLASAAP